MLATSKRFSVLSIVVIKMRVEALKNGSILATTSGAVFTALHLLLGGRWLRMKGKESAFVAKAVFFAQVPKRTLCSCLAHIRSVNFSS